MSTIRLRHPETVVGRIVPPCNAARTTDAKRVSEGGEGRVGQEGIQGSRRVKGSNYQTRNVACYLHDEL